MDFDLSEEQQLIYQYGDQLAQRFDRKYWMENAATHRFPTEMFQQIADDGFLGVMVPESYGGAGLGLFEMTLFMEGLANNGIPLLSLVVSSTMSLPLIARYGTEEQKQRYLPDLCAGRTKFCFAITEPGAGSNTPEITTIARKSGAGYLLSGQKTFITDANDADFALVVTRTTPRSEVTRKTDGFTLFLVDLKAPGVDRAEIDIRVPMPESQWQLFFDDVQLTEADALGEFGRGFDILFDTLNPERIVVAAICSGLGRYALGRAVEYACEREVFSGPIGAYQGLQHPLAESKALLEAASLMTLKAAWCFDHNRPTGEAANTAKLTAADAGIKAVDASIQCFGGNGFTGDYGIYEIYPMVRLLKTAPVSREMILNYIGEKVLGLPRSY
ncbi:MAG: acyl-CoA/acyl-ACP dehydrogenase [Gammaproteobacteria bacterium]|nr:acyl-CoA/acyl-ACP dehydrogenase [Gammaproteobacteria bacterium]